jgi:hypothetical protein
VCWRIDPAPEKTNHRLMRCLLTLALPTLLATMLAGCEIANSASAPEVAREMPRRCLHCGWIESKRAVPPDAWDPRATVAYEYTVRMSDGSHSVFRGEHPSSWREGERLILINGAGN